MYAKTCTDQKGKNIYLTKEELKKIQIIKHNYFEIKLNANKMKYKKPIYGPEICILKQKSFSSSINIPIEIKYKKKTIINKYISIGEIPIMTEKGTFIINGNTRVIINQIVRSPGIYFERSKKDNSIISTIIPNKGSWISIKIDKQGEIFTRIDKMKKKIPIITLLKALGLTKKKIYYTIKDIKLIKNISKETDINILKSLLKINEIILEQKSTIMRFQNAKNFLNSKFMDNKYDLSEIGRSKINKKIYKKELWKNQRTLRPEDILGTLNYLLKVKNENNDDIDDLKNKRIRSSGELLKNQINTFIYDIIKDIKEKIEVMEEKIIKSKDHKIEINEIINKNILTNVVKRFFTSNQLSQIMEETNPLAEITHKRKISSFGVGAIDKKKTNLNVREIHPSHFGRICPIETTEGKNAGLILSLSKDTSINKHGFIETPFYKIIKKYVRKDKGIFYLSSEQEKKLNLAPADLFKNKKNKIKGKSNKKTYIRKNQSFIIEKIKNLNFINTSTNQIISIGTGLIPFIEHDDANRALMGSNMQRQALATFKKEKPIIETGIENEIAKSSQSTIKSKKTGIVEFVTNKKLIISSIPIQIEKRNNISLNQKIKKNLITFIQRKKIKKNIYFLENSRKSNQNTYLQQIPNIKKKEYVKKGQIIVDSNSTFNGILSLGKNILIGYIGWEGYNFEDAIIISDRLVEEDIFTSIHIKKYKTFLIKNENEEVTELITRKIPDTNLKTTKILKRNGIIKIGSKIQKEEILIGKIKIIKERGIINKLLNSIFEKNIIKDTSIKAPKSITGIVTKIKIVQKKLLYTISIYITEKRKIEIGDKLAGRHGNKGIIAKILPREDMPYLQDGSQLDMILNPLGIPSRMNVGQIYECLLTLAGINLIEKYKILPFDEMQKAQTSKNLIYQKLQEAKEKTNKNWLFNYNYPGKTKVFDGRNGIPFQQPLLVGYAYILKLMHLVKDKINARLTGPYSLILKQPLRGKARNGGQRFGEMEVWAIESFGAAYTLQEILTIKSDDLTNRSEALFSIMKSKQLPQPSINESLKTLIIELQALSIDLKIFKVEKKNF
uniref:RNA polymerase subunit beta n=1 Tax=Euglena deses TaxID=66845 RepID=UPI0023AB3AD5|nr:RNA polymerase subunit beta [Euglena deses]WCH63397.1 RNA polymerase subunit beta [Euglena deses]